MKYEYISVFVMSDNFTVTLIAVLTVSGILLFFTVPQSGCYPRKRECIRSKHVFECNQASTCQSHETLDII